MTGGCGFIGSHLAEALAGRGDDVLVVDSMISGSESNLQLAFGLGVRLEPLDVTDGGRLARVTATFRPEVIYHLAAQIDVRRSMTDPCFDARTNVLGTVNVLEAARAAGTARLINSSTGGAMYGAAKVVPTPETARAQPESAYGLSKRCAEQYCEWYGRDRGLSTVSLRYGNVVGPRQNPLGEAGVVSIFCRLAAQRRPPVVYGDGRQTRDYVDVSDVVRANLAAAASVAVQGAVNVGTGVETSVLGLVEVIRTVAGIEPSDFQPELRPARAGELTRSCLDAGRARRRLGVAAKVDLASAVRRVLEATDRGPL